MTSSTSVLPGTDGRHRTVAPDEWPSAATCAVLQLALGGIIRPLSPSEWREALWIAVRERLAAVIWSGRSSIIRARAPEDVADAWRRAALKVGIDAHAHAEILLETVTSMQSVGLTPTVLKGLPLASLLYGDFSVRPVTDLDLFIPAADRQNAFEHLTRAGWHWRSGIAPNEETFERAVGSRTHHLELHSSLIDDPLLGYVKLRLETEAIPMNGVAVPALSRKSSVAFLAAHQAKHHAIPLLWVIDFHRLSQKLNDAERAAGASVTAECGLLRHYDRARHLAALANAVGNGREEALQPLIRAIQPVSELQRGIRLIKLATPRDRMRVVSGRVWPHGQRSSSSVALSYFARRTSGWMYRQLAAAATAERASRGADSSIFGLGSARTIQRKAPEREEIVFRPVDSAMCPTIPTHSSVRVSRNRHTPMETGSVILVRGETGLEFLARVVGWSGGNPLVATDDAPHATIRLAPENLLGIATLVSAYGVTWRVPSSPFAMMPALKGILSARLATLARRLRVGRRGRRHEPLAERGE